jgi:hypothetical protein
VAAGSGPERQRNHLDELLHAHTTALSVWSRARVQWRRRNEREGGKRGRCHPKIAAIRARPRFTMDPRGMGEGWGGRWGGILFAS